MVWASVLMLLKGTSKSVPASVIRRFEPTTLNELINSLVSLASPGIALPPTFCHVVPSQAYNCPVSVSIYVSPEFVPFVLGAPEAKTANSLVSSVS